MHFDQHELDRRTLLRAGLGAATVAVVGTELASAARGAGRPRRGPVLDHRLRRAGAPGRRRARSRSAATRPTRSSCTTWRSRTSPTTRGSTPTSWPATARTCTWTPTGGRTPASTSRSAGAATCWRAGTAAWRRCEAGDQQVISAHCPGENGNAIGIENEGTYVTETPPAGAARLAGQALRHRLPAVRAARPRHLRPLGLPGHRLPGRRVLPRSSRRCAAGWPTRSAPPPATSRRAAGRTSGASSAARSSRSRSTC